MANNRLRNELLKLAKSPTALPEEKKLLNQFLQALARRTAAKTLIDYDKLFPTAADRANLANADAKCEEAYRELGVRLTAMKDTLTPDVRAFYEANKKISYRDNVVSPAQTAGQLLTTLTEGQQEFYDRLLELVENPATFPEEKAALKQLMQTYEDLDRMNRTNSEEPEVDNYRIRGTEYKRLKSWLKVRQDKLSPDILAFYKEVKDVNFYVEETPIEHLRTGAREGQQLLAKSGILDLPDLDDTDLRRTNARRKWPLWSKVWAVATIADLLFILYLLMVSPSSASLGLILIILFILPISAFVILALSKSESNKLARKETLSTGKDILTQEDEEDSDAKFLHNSVLEANKVKKQLDIGRQ